MLNLDTTMKMMLLYKAHEYLMRCYWFMIGCLLPTHSNALFHTVYLCHVVWKACSIARFLPLLSKAKLGQKSFAKSFMCLRNVVQKHCLPTPIIMVLFTPSKGTLCKSIWSPHLFQMVIWSLNRPDFADGLPLFYAPQWHYDVGLQNYKTQR